jgi:hypothetical protein
VNNVDLRGWNLRFGHLGSPKVSAFRPSGLVE